jgi:hypothetical protein
MFARRSRHHRPAAASITSTILPFAAGFAAGVWVGRNWDSLRDKASPTLKAVFREASDWLGRGQAAWAEQQEQMDDTLATWKERLSSPPPPADAP